MSNPISCRQRLTLPAVTEMPGPVIYVAVAISAVAAVIVFKEVCSFCILHITRLIARLLVRLRASFSS
jgi:hypothetical protein